MYKIIKNTSLATKLVQNNVQSLSTTVSSVKKRTGKDIVIIEGARTPFVTSGSLYKDMMGYELQKHAVLYVVSNDFQIAII